MKKDVRQITDQAKRLYFAARELRRVEGKSAVAALMNISPQQVNHWENGRPISHEALLIAQEKIGCDAVWLRDGTGDMVRGGSSAPDDLSDVARLVSLYGQADVKARRLILDFASDQVEIIQRDGGRSSHKV